MTNAVQAAIVAAGTAVVLAPINPQALRDSEPAPAPAPTFTAVLLAHAEATLAARVRTALGMPGWQPRADLGETETRILVWSQLELDDFYLRTGGTVTTQMVERAASDGTTWTAEEITLTVAVPGVGPVQVFTDWEESLAKFGARNELPLMRAITA
ncbi:hypothetical protein ACFWH4_01280 [Streptomyces sp. NPDC127091]|uniref:hypothetical protein n=1 Tax=Streptomyces sp. NPDC127091 TaxID=3347134 RepID=UPI003669104D